MDLIDRQAAIDAVVNTVSEIGLHDNSEVARYGATFRQHEILDIIEGIPSVQPERRTGEWLMKPDPYGFFEGIPVCSECGCTTKWREKYLYCPNCGAKMEGETDETD